MKEKLVEVTTCEEVPDGVIRETLYPRIGVPPVSTGAVQVMVIVLAVLVPGSIIGEPGTVGTSVIWLTETHAVPVPATLWA